jgi:hypothetical protein
LMPLPEIDCDRRYEQASLERGQVQSSVLAANEVQDRPNQGYMGWR